MVFQIEPFSKVFTGGVLYKKCSQKFRKIHRIAPVPESVFNKFTSLEVFQICLKKDFVKSPYCEFFWTFLGLSFTKQLRVITSAIVLLYERNRLRKGSLI